MKELTEFKVKKRECLVISLAGDDIDRRKLPTSPQVVSFISMRVNLKQSCNIEIRHQKRMRPPVLHALPK
jgi:hypothetical protein